MIDIINLYPDRIAVASIVNRLLLLGLWLSLTWTFLAMVRIFIFEGIIKRKRGQKLPDLLTNLFRLVVLLLATMMIALNVFNVSEMTIGLLFGGSAAVVAIFFRDFLAELFAGLSINLDQGIDIGYRLALPNGTRGIVQDMNWRSVSLLQNDDSTAIVPNTLMAQTIVRNLNAREDREDVSFELTLDFSLPVDRAVRVLGAALTAASQEKGIVSEPSPRAYALGPGTFGITYTLDFSYHSETIDEGHARSVAMRSVMTHLMGSGLTIALPKQNVFVGEVRMMAKNWEKAFDREALIGNLELFASLEQGELKKLADSIIIHHAQAGQEIITEGDLSTSMYGLAEGVLEVSVAGEGRKQVVAMIEPGNFLGEMSMLAGEPRSATVTALVDSMIYELQRDSFSEVLNAREELAESISRLVVERQLANNRMLTTASNEERKEALSNASSNLLGKIRSVFSIFNQED